MTVRSGMTVWTSTVYRTVYVEAGLVDGALRAMFRHETLRANEDEV